MARKKLTKKGQAIVKRRKGEGRTESEIRKELEANGEEPISGGGIAYYTKKAPHAEEIEWYGRKHREEIKKREDVCHVLFSNGQHDDDFRVVESSEPCRETGEIWEHLQPAVRPYCLTQLSKDGLPFGDGL